MAKIAQLFFLFVAIQISAQEIKPAVSDLDNAYIQEMKTENEALTSRIKTFPENIQDLNKQVSQAIREKNDKKVLILALEMDKLFPNNADINNFLGKRYANDLEYAEAIKKFDQSIKFDNKNKWFYINKATAQAQNNEIEEALKTVESLIVLYPNWSIGYNLKASFLRELNLQSEALRAYEMAVISDPKSAQILTNRGDLYLELSKPIKAKADYKKALKTQPDYGLAKEKLNAIAKTTKK